MAFRMPGMRMQCLGTGPRPVPIEDYTMRAEKPAANPPQLIHGLNQQAARTY